MAGGFEVFVHNLATGSMESHGKTRPIVTDRVFFGCDNQSPGEVV